MSDNAYDFIPHVAFNNVIPPDERGVPQMWMMDAVTVLRMFDEVHRALAGVFEKQAHVNIIVSITDAGYTLVFHDVSGDTEANDATA